MGTAFFFTFKYVIKKITLLTEFGTQLAMYITSGLN